MNLIEVEVHRLWIQLDEENREVPVVLLKEIKGDRYLPIIIGRMEFDAISLAINKEKFIRPLTHDLLKTVIEGLGGRVEKIVINKIIGHTFYARIIIRLDNKIFTIDARPSDSIALALRTKSPIFVSEDVMNKASVRTFY